MIIEMTELSIRTLGNRVIVLPDSKEEKSEGGILLPEVAQQETLKGTVVKVGPGFRRTDDPTVHVPMNCTLGDRLYFSKYASTMFRVKHEGVEYIIMREDDILAIEE